MGVKHGEPLPWDTWTAPAWQFIYPVSMRSQHDCTHPYLANGMCYRCGHAYCRSTLRRVINEHVRKISKRARITNIDKMLIRGDKSECYYCHRSLGKYDRNYPWTVDHKIPVARGGSHALYNMVIACSSCNNLKDTMTDEEFLSSSKLLERQLSYA